jgi:hypothetical protein
MNTYSIECCSNSFFAGSIECCSNSFFAGFGGKPTPHDLQQWADAHKEESVPPGDLDQMFCLHFHIDLSKGHFAFFVLVMTSRRLIQFTPSNAVAIHNDDTQNVVYQGFPVMQTGTTDTARNFKLMAISLCSHKDADAYEQVAFAIHQRRPDIKFRHSISDAACAIYNGTLRIYPQLVQHMCWYYCNPYPSTLSTLTRHSNPFYPKYILTPYPTLML